MNNLFTFLLVAVIIFQSKCFEDEELCATTEERFLSISKGKEREIGRGGYGAILTDEESVMKVIEI